jgi:signal transduction histidine kinase/DNA-binding response OmpR family regulator
MPLPTDLARFFRASPNCYVVLAPDLSIVEANDAYLRVTGRRREELIGRNVFDAFPGDPALPDDGHVRELRASFERVLATGRADSLPLIRYSIPRDTPAGGVFEDRYWSATHTPILDDAGAVAFILQHTSDVTMQQQVQTELDAYRDRLEDLVRERTDALERSEAERQAAQEALRQVQKMEAVGKLTGGVAHDFNNVLQIIAGNLQLLGRAVAGDIAALRHLEAALEGVDRGAKLAAQLLAFARRQPLAPSVVDLGALVQRMEGLLRRAVGEAVSVETSTGEGLWNACVDPNQMESAILNLALNARDAMDARGRLRIAIANAVLDERYAARHAEVTPGEYVMVAVSDDGRGMTSDVLERAFEPFFTTKPEGAGTGLGLSMVYGFVRQSGGHVHIESRPGAGTAVRLYLPRSRAEPTPLAERPGGAVEGGNETILVVEDDDQVRQTVVEMLAELGYRVLEATDGRSALEVVKSGQPIDLLFTDVVMPGPVRSVDLAAAAKEANPELEVLFTSGYSENAALPGGGFDVNANLLGKPYRRDELAARLRHMVRNQQHRRVLEAAVARARAARAAAARPDGLAVLVVEDNDKVRTIIGEYLQELGHRATLVRTAEDALDALGAGGVDVLLTDVSLPGMSGLDLVQQVAELHPAVQPIVSSGFGDRLTVRSLPNVRLLAKPYAIGDLERVLREIRAAGGPARAD